ncbi:signal peptide peptidase SppA [Azotosporobacter soli]|uniref:signal peptide peptidase SppA n=1 Tax=Azotosporobacter soli TaxID=3055040 RepID=UPI0031FED935
MHKKVVVILLLLLLTGAAVVLNGSGHWKKAESEKIAIIHVEGVILGGRGQSGFLSEQGGTDQLIRLLHQARDDQAVKAVVLRINSPGGSAPASQEVGEEIMKLRSSGKVVVTSMGDIAASGGYWLAACTERIYANPTTLTGSIGVYIPYANWEELFKKVGIQQEKIKSGPHKDILSPDRPMTPEERAMLQSMVDDIYQQFIQVVAEGRNMELERVRQLADGRVYTGNQAKELGLVDELGNMYDAVEGAAALAGIHGKPKLQEYGKTSPWQMLTGGETQGLLRQMLLPTLPNAPQQLAPLALPENWQVK